VRNTHPFALRGRIMAHNGGLGELARLDEQLGPYAGLVLGDTDSERYFALITQQIDAHGGDVGEGITAAARWIAANLPVSSLNAVVATPGELWALRYPGQHALHIIERPAGSSSHAGPAGEGGLHARSTTSSFHVPALDSVPSVVVASEELDGESGWRMLAEGELVHVGPDLSVQSSVVIAEPPAHLVPISPNPNIDT
jgi:predicted glutamine amidotransferase